MNCFQKLFSKQCSAIGMIHVGPLPGTPKYNGNWLQTIERARHEANVYHQNKIDGILIENMHDIPYVQNTKIGYEVLAGMTRIATEIKQIIPSTTPCGVQVLASGNCQGLAIAKVCDLQFIRAEGFVFGHVADEGYTDACAGQVIRYRKQIDCENVAIFTDIKKKHCSHAITDDLTLLDTAKAAQFFMADGIIITGNATGESVNLDDLNELHNQLKIPVIIGSGITAENLAQFYEKSNAVIVGSHFKINGNWENDLSEEAVSNFMTILNELRKTSSVQANAQ